MVLGYETSKLLVMQAAWMKDQGKRIDARDVAREVACDRVGVRGGAPRDPGVRLVRLLGEYGIERYFRNARAPIIYEGTTQIHKMMQAEHALGYRRLNGRGGEVSPLCSWAPALSPVHA